MFLEFDELKRFKPRKDTYFVFGSPIGHSLSPLLHSVFFKNNGIEADYIAAHVTKAQLYEAVGLVRGYAKGVNLTIPLKEHIIPILDEMDGAALEIGAVNTLKFAGGKIKGYNTDRYGIERSVDLSGRDVLILGSGGASKAFLSAGLRHGKSVSVCGRDLEKATEFCRGTRARPAVYDGLDIADGTYILNGTPVGMGALMGGVPVPIGIIKKCGFIFDSIYNPARTNLLVLGEMYGKPTENGLKMLIHQGTKAQEIWGNADGAPDCPYRELEKALSGGMENIVLIGFMGSGKTTVGKMVAEKLGRAFVDTDEIIEDVAGMSVTEIFAGKGEAFFRETESAVCGKVSRLNGAVISTGGGAVGNPANAAALKRNGKIFFLDTPLCEIKKRLATDDTRPLIKDKSGIDRIYAERRGQYLRACDAAISENTPEAAASAVIRASTVAKRAPIGN
jgi:shikimate dehydrogenase